jgi:uncharacterized membrane protein (DUF485 family)
MEARKFEETNDAEARTIYYAQPKNEAPLTQEYKPIQRKGQQSQKSRKRELSFFMHVSAYSILFMLLYPLLSAFLPFILSFPVALVLPIGIILGSKRLFKKYVINTNSH